ncbi:MAG: GNAT family N-acetyltransferase [Hyphomicrobiaceae bacterium]
MLNALITASEVDGYWTLQAQILALNSASRALHAKAGFREVGTRERYGHIDDVWHDVVLMERRSPSTGGPGLPTRTCG